MGITAIISEKNCKEAGGTWDKKTRTCHNPKRKLFFYEGKYIDGWTVIHAIAGLIFGLITFFLNIIIVAILVILFEFFEHVYLGDKVFKWNQDYFEGDYNAIIDAVVGIAFLVVGRLIIVGIDLNNIFWGVKIW